MLLLLQACATYQGYPGPARPDGEIAILEGYWHFYFVAVRVVKIVSIDGAPAWSPSGDVTRVMLPPGRHRIGIRMLSAFGEVGLESDCTFEAQFDPGRRYRIESFDLSASQTDIPLEMTTHFGGAATTGTIACLRTGGWRPDPVESR